MLQLLGLAGELLRRRRQFLGGQGPIPLRGDAEGGRQGAERREELSEWHFDCLTSVAALGFGDIPPEAFFTALKFLRTDGWVAFNIKETFLDHSYETGFSRFIRELIFSEYLDVYKLERYTHRLSMEGVPLKYFAFVGRLAASIPLDFLESIGVVD